MGRTLAKRTMIFFVENLRYCLQGCQKKCQHNLETFVCEYQRRVGDGKSTDIAGENVNCFSSYCQMGTGLYRIGCMATAGEALWSKSDLDVFVYVYVFVFAFIYVFHINVDCCSYRCQMGTGQGAWQLPGKHYVQGQILSQRNPLVPTWRTNNQHANPLNPHNSSSRLS